jgi:hypothetical protein
MADLQRSEAITLRGAPTPQQRPTDEAQAQPDRRHRAQAPAPAQAA